MAQCVCVGQLYLLFADLYSQLQLEHHKASLARSTADHAPIVGLAQIKSNFNRRRERVRFVRCRDAYSEHGQAHQHDGAGTQTCHVI